MIALALALAMACGSAPAELEAYEIGRMDGVVWQTETLTVEVAEAWLSPDQPIAATATSVTVTDEAPPLQIDGKTSRWRLKDGVVVFETDVVAVRGDVTMTCERLEVTYAGERVERAVATGGVRVVKGERVGTAERAVLTTRDGRIEMTEQPRLSEGPNTMEGQRITLFLDEEEALCESCRLVVAGEAIRPEPTP